MPDNKNIGNTRIYLGISAAYGRMIFDPNGRFINKYELKTIQALIEWQASLLNVQKHTVSELVTRQFGVNEVADLKASASNDVVNFLYEHRTQN